MIEEEQLRLGTRELIDSYGEPQGLRSRVILQLPPGRAPVPWLAYVAAALLVAAIVTTLLAVIHFRSVGTAPIPATQRFEARPLLAVTVDSSCRVQTQAKSQNGRELEFAQMGPGVPSDLPYGYFPRLTQPLAAGLPAPLGFTSRGSTGPVLVRARTLQAGGGTLGLLPGDGPPGTGGNATVITSAAGDRVRVFTSVEFPAATGPWQLVLAPDKPGCYALQLDGNDFTEVLVADVPGGPVNGNAPYLVSAASVARVVAAHAPAGHRILTVAVPADWAAVVSVDGEAYTVSYFSTSGPTRTVTIGEPQPPFLPHPGLVVRPVTYRGDGKASYLAHDSPADTGRRSVLWTEADGSGFLLNATGYTDAQFWRLAAGVS